MFQDGLKYQDSHMSTPEEFIRDLMPVKITDRRSPCGGPVLFRKGDTVYVDGSESHNLYVGDTGSMKTLRFVLPLIHSCAIAGESMLTVDPKGELATKMTPFLKEQGYKVVTLNIRDPLSSPDRWNPFGLIADSYQEGRIGRHKALMQLSDLISLLFCSKDCKDPYWNDSAGQFALGICQTILKYEGSDELTLSNLLQWRHTLADEDAARALLSKLPKDSEEYQNLSGTLKLTAQNTKTCILSTFDQMMRLFTSAPALTEMLSESTFDMRRIGSKKMAVFLVVPDEKTTFHFLATLFVSQCYAAILEQESFPIRVNFILEEFCNMPTLPDLIPMLTAARSRNIRLHMVIQSYGQLVSKYGESDSKAALDNCNLIYLHTRELSFLKYISELAGYNEYNRPLISPSRLQRLAKNETLIFFGRCYPFLTRDIPLIFEYPVTLGKELPKRGYSCRLDKMLDELLA